METCDMSNVDFNYVGRPNHERIQLKHKQVGRVHRQRRRNLQLLSGEFLRQGF